MTRPWEAMGAEQRDLDFVLDVGNLRKVSEQRKSRTNLG